jgi:hypothetical protein
LKFEAKSYKELVQAKVLIQRIKNRDKSKLSNLRAMVGLEAFKEDAPIERISTKK